MTDDPTTQTVAELRHEIKVLWQTIHFLKGAVRFYQFSSQHWKARAEALKQSLKAEGETS